MIEIKEDVKIGDIILEAGDKIKVLKESDASRSAKDLIQDCWRKESGNSSMTAHYTGSQVGEELADIAEYFFDGEDIQTFLDGIVDAL